MVRRISVTVERFPLAAQFTIARGSKTEAAVVVCTIAQGDAIGRGECVLYARYGESVETVTAAIEAIVRMRAMLRRGRNGARCAKAS